MIDPKVLAQLYQISAAIAVLLMTYLILKLVFDFVKKPKAVKEPPEPEADKNGKAGEKNTAFWLLNIDKIVETRLDRLNEKLERKVDEHFERLERKLDDSFRRLEDDARGKGAGS